MKIPVVLAKADVLNETSVAGFDVVGEVSESTAR
jgi:hypothetical protein